jgi:photosystem II stability/assembly factor-like uncharacterized protein
VSAVRISHKDTLSEQAVQTRPFSVTYSFLKVTHLLKTVKVMVSDDKKHLMSVPESPVKNHLSRQNVLRSGAAADANDIFVLSETEAYVVEDYSGIFHTADAGKHWDDYSFTTGNWYLGIAVLQEKNIWVVGSPGAGLAHSALIYSPDGGFTWKRQTVQVLEDTYVGLYKVRFMLKR